MGMYMTDTNGTAMESPKLKFKTLLESANIAEELSQDYLNALGQMVVSGYWDDRGSRQMWEQKNEKAMKLALQVVESKSFPWVDCSNVKFPMLTIAALQFLSRVSILTKGRQIVKCDTLGLDPSGKEGARGKRIAAHMSYQLVEADPNWLDDDEKAKFSASIVGCAFKKTHFDPVEGMNLSPHVPAALLVVDYFTKDLDKANRVTHEIPMTVNDIEERVRRKIFSKLDRGRNDLPAPTAMSANNQPAQSLLIEAQNQAQGLSAPSEDSLCITSILEQYLWLDLDGDGLQEPYIVSVTIGTGQVLRVVARYLDQGDVIRVNDSLVRKLEDDMLKAGDEPEIMAKYKKEIQKLRDAADNAILRFVPKRVFTKIPFIPSPDGGFYDLGLGSLVGPLNEAVNTLTNQLIDNGTMQNTAGGFLGRGVKMKGGSTAFAPFEWKPVDSTGDDLRKNIMPMPVNTPSPVLFELLGMLVNYGERISGATDIMSGVSPGQNTPAETSRNTIEQGMKIFSGIYTRMYRAFRRELSVYKDLNETYLEENAAYFDLVSGEGAMISRDDYLKGKFSIRPAADPATASETQRQQRAMLLKEAASTTPGYDRYEVEKLFLEAFDVPNIDTVYPDPKGPRAIAPPQNPKIELEKAKLAAKAQEHKDEMQLAIADFQAQIQVNQAKITELEAKATKELAEANGVDVGHQIALIDAQVGAAKHQQEGLLKALSLVQQAIEFKHSMTMEQSHDKGSSDTGGSSQP